MVIDKKKRRILISQPAPEGRVKSPYARLETELNCEIVYQKLIQSVPVSVKEFRNYRLDIGSFSATVITSRHSANFLFQLIEDLRIDFPEHMKFICTSESIALYLQKFIKFRKRKILFPQAITTAAFLQLVQKHKNEKFLFPMAVGTTSDLLELMKKAELDVVSTEIYRTIPEEIPGIDFSVFDMLLVFSPIGIDSIFQNAPDFKQNDLILAVSGKNTADAAIAAGLRVDIMAPSPKYLSMMDAIIDFFKLQASK